MSDDPYQDCGCPPDRGHAHPRFFTPPLRELTPQTSDGFRCIAFGKALGLRLLPWQKWFLIHALELKPDGSYRFGTLLLLVSRQAGKTTLAVLIMLYWAVIKRKQLVVNAAQDMATAREAWDSCVAMFEENELLEGQMLGPPSMAAGQIALRLTEGRRMLPKASNRKAGRGLSIDGLFLDELREQRNWEAWDALKTATIARSNAQTLAASNAGDVESVVLAFLRDSALADIKNGTNSGVFIAEWSAPDDDDPGAVDTWRKSNPGLGYTITIEAMASEFATKPLTSFRTENLTQFVQRMDSPIDLVAWGDSSDPRGDLRHVFKRSDLHMAVEVAHDGQHVSLIGAGVDRTDSLRERVRVGVIKSWAGSGAVAECERELKEIIDKARPRTLSWFPNGPGAVLKVAMFKIKSAGKIVPLTGPSVSSACASFSEQVSARAIIHGGETLFATQILAAARTPMGDGWRFTVKGIGAHVDSLYGASAAVQQARLTPFGTFKIIVAKGEVS